jgi:hypothetical protein
MHLRALSLLLFVFFVVSYAFVRVHQRVHTILIGYEIGKLKDQESQLLKKQSLLTVELAKITSKQHLAKRIGLAAD